ncbi:alkaline phosphatase D family protein [Botrimarina sp.]|uniref:alkaline phosphatase D family protein n=1 Tax=Botrimarina sp. TaxID=2795802 RepID=UPI0032F00288
MSLFRNPLKLPSVLAWAQLLVVGVAAAQPYLAEGVKVGEVSSDTAIVWTRLCTVESVNERFQLPGAEGEVRVRYRPPGGDERQTAWTPADPNRDFTAQVRLEGLSPQTRYAYVVEARNGSGTAELGGEFDTAPSADQPAPVRFVVTTGHKHQTAEEIELGPRIYPAMAWLQPHFFIHTGDVVYYDLDTDPLAESPQLARLHWHRMYSLERRVAFHRRVASYFIKDDHDLLKNDCWPGQTYGDLTFNQGVRIFDEQTPSSDKPYRTFRWGKDLQIWLVEGREFRSPNDQPDGPGKTIWGDEQMRWLKHSMRASDATFRLLVTPTPVVGPDRENKFDNHSNDAFAYEGADVREFLSGLERCYVVCGDRHWQYVSVDDQTGLREYSCGSSTDEHSGGWGKDDKRPQHEFLRVAGGFLSVEVTPGDEPTIAFRLHDVDGRVVHTDLQPSGG